MKILEVEIESIRGVKDRIPLILKGQNTVIFGPNGTGKSAIVDAIDFLFTGNISRLTGRGSRGLSLDEHGPHIDAKPNDAIIKAKVSFDSKEPVILERRMADPKKLHINGKTDSSDETALQIAEKGQHVLSRSEILNFIEAESGHRSKEIQALLNLNKVEDIRATFVTINREADKKLQSDKTNFLTSVTKVKDVLKLNEFEEGSVLKKVNEHRKILNGNEIDTLDLKRLKEGINPRTHENKERVYPAQVKTTLTAIKEFLETKGAATFKAENQLRAIVRQLKEDVKLKRDLQNKRLLDLGISLIDESGSCPLCLTEFEPGKLSRLINGRLTTAHEAEKIENKIIDLSSQIAHDVSVLKGHVELLSESAKKLKFDDTYKELCEWISKLSGWLSALNRATEDYPVTCAPEDTVSFFSCSQWIEHYKRLEDASDNLEKLSPEQTAWDTLTALHPVLERCFEDKEKYDNSINFSIITNNLSNIYTKTKDQILERLYDSVNADFAEYYKYLHEIDESIFDSELRPDGAHLEFKVDFYGRGKHHPRALHSEGHQDSMGLCLFLALNKKISEGKVGIVILDDVVMSIDSEHRRSICKLLSDKFNEMQFIITTHNTTWARQLKSDGVVTERNMIRFMGWSVDSGPKMRTEAGDWAEIDVKVVEGDISAAAAMLRQHLEFFFEAASDSLKAKVQYKSDARYELGDFIIGCKERLNKLLSKAKKSAQSWGNNIEQFKLLETQVKEIVGRSQSEQWAINAAVHYNKWQDFTKEDFIPIVEAFKDFESLFKCTKCDGILSLGMQGVEPILLKCPCGSISWNLEIKK